MKQYLKYLAMSFVVATALVACSDSESATATKTIEKEEILPATSFEDLPECNDENNGVLAFVADERAKRICVDGAWQKLGASSVKTVYDTLKCHTEKLKDSSGVKIICGKDSVGVVKNGSVGDKGPKGETGDAGIDGKDGEKGITGDKGDTGVTGDPGRDGKDGIDGEKGPDGYRGDYCYMEKGTYSSTIFIYCTDQTYWVAAIYAGSNGSDGYDGNDGVQGPNGEFCSLETLYDNSGVMVVCQDDTVGIIKNGTNGKDGYVGKDGTGCHVEPYYDGTASDIYCDGEFVGVITNGKDGKNGSNGNDGTGCWMERLANDLGNKIICDGDSLGVILDGADGADGTPGKDGTGCWMERMANNLGNKIVCAGDSMGFILDGVNGIDGTDGADGTSCLMVRLENNLGNKIICAGDSVGVIMDGTNGTDGIVCEMSALKNSTGFKISCDGDSVGVVKNGADGTTCSRELLSNGLGYKLVCNGDSVGEWYDELGLCTSARENDVATQRGAYYICQSKVWKSATVAQYDHFGQTCAKADSGTVVRGVVRDTAYYFCNGTTWRTASIFERNTYGLVCDGAGKLFDGLVYDTAKYVCESDTFRVANNLERSLGLGCVSYTKGIQTDSVYSTFAYGVYECKKPNATTYAWDLISYEYTSGVYGTLTDSRDGKMYKTVTIGSQTWMAENLNFVDSALVPSLKGGRATCYEGFETNCDKYGRLYTWSAAIDSVALYDNGHGEQCGYKKNCTLPARVRGICPENWHLPTLAEWQLLFDVVGGSSIAAKNLKTTTDWYNNNGVDIYGFSMMPGGHRAADGYYSSIKQYAFYWTTSQYGDSYAYDAYFYNGYDNAMWTEVEKNIAFSVRCLMDSE